MWQDHLSFFAGKFVENILTLGIKKSEGLTIIQEKPEKLGLNSNLISTPKITLFFQSEGR